MFRSLLHFTHIHICMKPRFIARVKKCEIRENIYYKMYNVSSQRSQRYNVTRTEVTRHVYASLAALLWMKYTFIFRDLYNGTADNKNRATFFLEQCPCYSRDRIK